MDIVPPNVAIGSDRLVFFQDGQEGVRLTRHVSLLAPHSYLDASPWPRPDFLSDLPHYTMLSTLPRCPLQLQYSLSSILNNRHLQPIKIPQTPRLAIALAYPFDLLQLFNLKAGLVAKLALDEERHKHRPLAVRVDAATGPASLKGGEEERRALRGLEGCGRAQVLVRGQVHDEHVGGLEPLLLDSRRREVDVWAMADGGAAAGAGDLWV